MQSRTTWRIVSLVFVLLSGVYFIRQSIEHFQDVLITDWSAIQLGAMALTVALYAITISVSGFVWQLLLRDYGINASCWQLQIILFISQFAKYMPGNVAHHVGRVYMARTIGIPVKTTVQSMLLEVIIGVCAGAIISIMSLLYINELVGTEELDWLDSSTLTIVILVTLVLPWGAIRFTNKLLPNLSKKISGRERIVEPRFLTAFFAGCLFVLNFCINGYVLTIQSEWIFFVDEVSVIKLSSLFAIAWLAGYLMPGAPAGLGVREAVMLVVLTPIVGTAVAAGLAITYRITTSLGDIFGFLFGVFARRIVTFPDVLIDEKGIDD